MRGSQNLGTRQVLKLRRCCSFQPSHAPLVKPVNNDAHLGDVFFYFVAGHLVDADSLGGSLHVGLAVPQRCDEWNS